MRACGSREAGKYVDDYWLLLFLKENGANEVREHSHLRGG
jgi:hypothetical protein